jgi:hypothetical protein
LTRNRRTSLIFLTWHDRRTNADVAPARFCSPWSQPSGREGEHIPAAPICFAAALRSVVDGYAVLVRDLGSRNGTFVQGDRVEEAQIFTGQTLRVGDVEMLVAEAPVPISVPPIALPPPPKEQLFMPDGTPCCFHHDNIAASLQCGKCQHVFCSTCVRELRVAGGFPRRFCPECGGPCEPLEAIVKEAKRSGWLDKIIDAFTKPPRKH